MRVDTIWRGAHLLTMSPSAHAGGLASVPNGLVAAQAGRIVYAGAAGAAPAMQAAREVACGGRWITPGLIDCHTHLVFGGDRCAEFQARLAGASYTELAELGGIRTTVAATRAASDAELLIGAVRRLDTMLAQGVTTLEIKSGYGLDVATELRMLRVARRLGAERAVRVVTTLLGAHALPPGQTDRAAYLATVIGEMLPAAVAEGLADAVDAFCEGIAFSAAEVAQLFAACQARGLPVKLHADQLSDGGGAALAARFNALSADHLEYAAEAGIAAMAQAGTVAVLLPGAFLCLTETQRPPVAQMRAHNVAMAVATDCNPGTSPLTSPLLAMNLAATLFGLTVEECLLGMTRHAAAALGLGHAIGTLEPGKRADLAIWSIDRPAELVYWMGQNPLFKREFAHDA